MTKLYMIPRPYFQDEKTDSKNWHGFIIYWQQMSANVATVKQFVKVNYNKNYHIYNKDQFPGSLLVALNKSTVLKLTTTL